MNYYSIFLSLLFLPGYSFTQPTNPIIPAPVQFEQINAAPVELSTNSILYYPPNFEKQAGYLREQILQQTGLTLSLRTLVPSQKAPWIGIVLKYDTTAINKNEMYQLKVSGNVVLIKARDIRGFVNATQTLLQLIPLSKKLTIKVPAVNITDYPLFSYRGMHLDVVRHLFPLSYIKKYIDYLTFHKFNTFHWHLTDDQGWRFESNTYPALNKVGSWRDSTLIGHFFDKPIRYDGKRYGGYYTKAEIKEVIEYAAIRGITIIPELDIPGHSRATIAAYPQMSTKPDTAWNVAITWGMFNRQNNVLVPNDFTFTFLKTIFKELGDLFPSAYIHIGGDECSHLWWKQDSLTQRFIRHNHLKNETGLQTYMVGYVTAQLKLFNKKVIGWHEIAEDGLDTSTLIMNWADDKKALEVAKKGFRIIMTPAKPFYFNNYQSKDPNDSLANGGYNPLDAVYNYPIIPDVVQKAKLANQIIGAQGDVWTEYIATTTKVDYIIFPRMTALSENLWSKTKNYPDFLRRLEQFMIPRYQSWNSSYFKAYRVWTKEK